MLTNRATWQKASPWNEDVNVKNNLPINCWGDYLLIYMDFEISVNDDRPITVGAAITNESRRRMVSRLMPRSNIMNRHLLFPPDCRPNFGE